MNVIEKTIKELIVERYGSLKAFCEIIDMPWTTLDSILKRGFINSNIGNVLKIAKELRISVEPLASGRIEPAYTSSLPLASQEERLLDVFHSLNDEGQEKVLEYIDDLTASEKYIKSDSVKLVEET